MLAPHAETVVLYIDTLGVERNPVVPLGVTSNERVTRLYDDRMRMCNRIKSNINQ